MGMDVYGKSGNYFRANIWSWRPICAAMDAAGYQVPQEWHYNDGAGLDNQKDCEELADLMERYLAETKDHVFEMESDFQLNGENPYTTDRGHLLAWVEFLRECGGGFEIF